MAFSKRSIKRRHILGAALAFVAAVPAARIALMRLKDNLLPPVAEPRVTFVDGWLLDEGDLSDGGQE